LLAGVGSRDTRFVAANGNDNFASAQNIAPAALPFTDSKDLTNATREVGEPKETTEGCSSTADPNRRIERTVWYSYTPPAGQRLVAHTFGNTDTVLAVFRAGAPDNLANLQLVMCNDDAQRNTAETSSFVEIHSQLVFDAAAGTKYYFQVGKVGRQGPFAVTFRLGVLNNAALLVRGKDANLAETQELEQALRKSPMWSHAPITTIIRPTDVELQAAITETYTGVPADGVALFVYVGHGGKRPQPPGGGGARDDPPADENNAGNDDRDELIFSYTRGAGLINDDRLGQLFQGVSGRKVLVFDSCYSGGLVDGTSDFRGEGRLVQGIFLLSTRPDQEANYGGFFRWGTQANHTHWLFAGALITGLSAADGRAAADGLPADGRITVNEWFVFAERLVRALVAERNARFPQSVARAQNPVLDESRAPAGARAGDVVIFSYTPQETALLEHPGPALNPQPENRLQLSDEVPDLQGCAACCKDFGDAPDPIGSIPGQYPTRESSSGARHLNAPEDGCPTCGLFTFEWLGSSVDDEDDADPERPDDDEDGDGDPGDAFDDGVEFERVSSSLIRVRVTVSVFDPQILQIDGQPRYDSSNPRKRLYLNGWADWNGDGIWMADEQIVGASAGAFAIDPRQDPQFADDGLATYAFDVPLPLSALTREFYFRFRLDYGEDAGSVARVDPTLDLEQGTAQFGEAEDYCDVLGLVPVFGGKSPPVSASVGRLTLNSRVSTNRSFRWRSSDSILGAIESNLVAATTWNYRPGSNTEPARLVFIGRFSNVSVQGNVLFEPYDRAVVDLVRGSQRVRYLLTLTPCRASEFSR
jgi:hypothetical protein